MNILYNVNNEPSKVDGSLFTFYITLQIHYLHSDYCLSHNVLAVVSSGFCQVYIVFSIWVAYSEF